MSTWIVILAEDKASNSKPCDFSLSARVSLNCLLRATPLKSLLCDQRKSFRTTILNFWIRYIYWFSIRSASDNRERASGNKQINIEQHQWIIQLLRIPFQNVKTLVKRFDTSIHCWFVSHGVANRYSISKNTHTNTYVESILSLCLPILPLLREKKKFEQKEINDPFRLIIHCLVPSYSISQYIYTLFLLSLSMEDCVHNCANEVEIGTEK